jgi:hypothetical protein
MANKEQTKMCVFRGGNKANLADAEGWFLGEELA